MSLRGWWQVRACDSGLSQNTPGPRGGNTAIYPMMKVFCWWIWGFPISDWWKVFLHSPLECWRFLFPRPPMNNKNVPWTHREIRKRLTSANDQTNPPQTVLEIKQNPHKKVTGESESWFCFRALSQDAGIFQHYVSLLAGCQLRLLHVLYLHVPPAQICSIYAEYIGVHTNYPKAQP